MSRLKSTQIDKMPAASMAFPAETRSINSGRYTFLKSHISWWCYLPVNLLTAGYSLDNVNTPCILSTMHMCKLTGLLPRYEKLIFLLPQTPCCPRHWVIRSLGSSNNHSNSTSHSYTATFNRNIDNNGIAILCSRPVLFICYKISLVMNRLY